MVWWSRPVARAPNTGAVFDMSGFCRDLDETRTALSVARTRLLAAGLRRGPEVSVFYRKRASPEGDGSDPRQRIAASPAGRDCKTWELLPATVFLHSIE
jgi:hypothetical protein